MAAGVRQACIGLPADEVVFFRNFVALIFLLPLLIRQRVSLRTDNFRFHLLRSLSGLAAMYLFFYAINHLPLADALLLNYTSPLFVTIFAVIWLKEGWRRQRQISLLLGLFGVVLLFRPSSHLASLAGLIGLASGVLAGLALTSVKRLSSSEPSIRIVTWFALLSSLIAVIPLFWRFVLPTFAQSLWLLGVGLCGAVGQMTLTMAYSRAPASQVAPLGFTALFFSGIIGYLFWHEAPPDAIGLIGSLAIIAAGVMVAREKSGS